MFHGGTAELDDDDCYDYDDNSYHDSDEEKIEIRMFHGDAAGLDDVDDDYDDGDRDDEFNIIKFHGDAVEPDNDYHVHDGDLFNIRKALGHATEPNIDYDCYDDEEFNAMRLVAAKTMKESVIIAIIQII